MSNKDIKNSVRALLKYIKVSMKWIIEIQNISEILVRILLNIIIIKKKTNYGNGLNINGM
jgi:hypothetical protein